MLNLTIKDKEIINSSYKNFLTNLKCFLESCKIESLLDCSKIIINMLRNGQFCIEGSIIFDNEFQYLYLPNMDYDGAYVMYEVCCCRHASALLHDVLQILESDSSLLYIWIDENNNWHISRPAKANHLTVLLKENGVEYILDPVNNFILKSEHNQRLTLVELDIFDNFSNYQDSNIKKIEKVLRKYYHLQKLSVDYIYDDD